ncbi:MAG: 50S ribosomal protein L23 [Chloroflexi bacterium]|nr:50S ribosomal protein L23 [Chloroflexota bacterium]
MHPYEVLKRPITTEKTSYQSGKLRQYSFEVDRRANKHDVKRAVEEIFKVTVVSVNMINVPAKTRRWGRIMGHKPAWKKAVVTLAPGNTIQLFEGV